MNLEQRAILIIAARAFNAYEIPLLLANLIVVLIRHDINITIKSGSLELPNIVRVHTNDMSDARCRR